MHTKENQSCNKRMCIYNLYILMADKIGICRYHDESFIVFGMCHSLNPYVVISDELDIYQQNTESARMETRLN